MPLTAFMSALARAVVMTVLPIGLILNTGPSTTLGLDNNPHSPLPKNMTDPPPPQGNNYYPVVVTQGYWVQARTQQQNKQCNN